MIDKLSLLRGSAIAAQLGFVFQAAAVIGAVKTPAAAMARVPMAIAAALLWLAGTGALAQSGSPSLGPEIEAAPMEPSGPIVNGHDLQPTVSEIMEREAIRHGGQPEPPVQNSAPADKELDELYHEVLKESQTRRRYSPSVN